MQNYFAANLGATERLFHLSQKSSVLGYTRMVNYVDIHLHSSLPESCLTARRYSVHILCCKPWRYRAPFPLEPNVKRIGLYTNGELCRYTSALLLTRELLNSSTVFCTHLSRFADMNSLYIAEPGPGPLDYESNSCIWPLLRSVRYMNPDLSIVLCIWTPGTLFVKTSARFRFPGTCRTFKCPMDTRSCSQR